MQQPILFDPAIERERKNHAAVLNETLDSIAEMLKAKQNSEVEQKIAEQQP